ncbi:cell division protein FtsQ/DivIB [Lacticaseibacillus absianus]|uniref:cell division protein FtsQ/DivIB n=1 Tax=Lacticaseibacillus absianus TaxID=2729623 RepID=UPI0015CE8932|nr:cell division protein FtsQ/DivIB [Lacticaseibacillus absianus]
MAWTRKRNPTTKDPLTPWEAYQARQARTRRPRPRLSLPQVTELRRHHRTRNLILVLAPLTVLLLFFGYMASPLAKVQEVSVTGTKNLPIQTVIDASQLGATDTIPGVLMARQQRLAQIKATVPEVRTISLWVTRLNHVTLAVKEYIPMGYVLTKGRYHMILENGTIMATSSTTPVDNYPVLTDFGARDAATMARAIRQFPSAVRRTISEVRATRGGSNPYQITMTMTDGNTVVADSRTVAKKISYYPAIVAQVKKRGTIDLEVGAYFTPYTK